MTITDLLQKVGTSIDSKNEVLTKQGLEDLKSFFEDAQLTEIRFYTGASSAFGHQATTILIIRRIIELGYTKGLTLIYEEDANDPVPLKLEVLLPGYQASTPNTNYQITATQTLAIISESAFKTGSPAETPLAITGGLERNANLANQDQLNVKCFLQLQPFQWTMARNQIWLKGNDTPVVLSEVDILGKSRFIDQAYFMSTPVMTDADWNKYLVGEDGAPINNDTVQKAKDIASAVTGSSGLNFMPVYGIGVDSAGQLRTLMGLPHSILFNLIDSIALAQRNGTAANKKGIIVGLVADIGIQQWKYFVELIKAQMGTKEETFADIGSFLDGSGGGDFDYDSDIFDSDSDDDGAASDGSTAPGDGGSATDGGDDSGSEADTRNEYELANRYVTQNQLNERVLFPSEESGFTYRPGEVQTLISSLKDDQILIVPIPNLPPDIFNYLYSISTYPFVFEGKGTANLALNLGKPYIHMAKSGVRVYPSIPPGASVVNPVISDLTEKVFELMMVESVWKDNPGSDAPGQKLGPVVQQMIAGGDNPVKQYFSSIAGYYHEPKNDKLVMALLYALPNYKFASSTSTLRTNLALRANADASTASTLQSLKDKIDTAIAENSLKLDDSILGGSVILEFITEVIDTQTLEIGGVTVDFSDTSKLVLSGQSDSFGLPGIQLALTFTEADGEGALKVSIQLVFSDAFTLLNTNWFQLENASVGMEVSEAGHRIIGLFTSDLILGSDTRLQLQLEFPNAEGELSFAGLLSGDLPNLEKIFQLAGGINFVKAFPPPLNVIANLGLQSFDFVYNLNQKKIAAFGIGLATTQEWEVVKNISLQSGMSIRLDVADPMGARAVSWIANAGFLVQSSEFDVTVSYPAKTINAGMAEDSDPLVLSDLVKTYLGDSVSTPNLGNVTALSLYLDFNKPLSYQISCGAELGWPALTILGKELFEIENVNFNIEGKGKKVFGSVEANTALFPDDAENRLDFNILARYKEEGGWVFQGTQTEGELSVARIINAYLGIFDAGWKLDVGSEHDFAINGIFLRFETAENANTFTFAAKTARPFEIPFPVDGAPTIEGSVLIGYQKPKQNNGSQQGSLYGAVNGTIHWHGIDLNVFYNFDPTFKAFGIRVGVLEGKIEQKTVNGKTEQIATLSFTKTTTLGSIVETMISWATGDRFGLAPPWDLLNKIPLSGLSLTFNLTTKAVSFNVAIGPIELGFCRINSIGVAYDASSDQGSSSTAANRKKRKVNIQLNGSFFWQGANAGEPIAWNAANPEETPAAPGAGSKYFDLRVLAMGQHVTIPEFQNAKKVQDAIAALKSVEVPERGELPKVTFNADSNWLFGTDFGVLRLGDTNEYFLTLQIIFNDPTLYGLRIALEGKPAKIFAGLDFQIMYRQVTDTVGVYQTEITLPDLMRHLTIGAYSITLPVFAIAVYTNGDFLVDLGFPHNQDFSRSFSVEAIIPPGIPVLGSAGFYFGKLSSASTNRVPAITNGSFNPVIVFGFGAQVGFGKSFTAGILKAGISLTVFGILEGVIAKFNAYSTTAVSTGSQGSLSGEYYFWLQGTFGIIGKVYGSVDFGIISADISIEIKVMAQITFESYADIIFSVIASVKATASVKINLGLFKITIDFSFSLRVKQSFTLPASGTPPWIGDKAQTNRSNSVLAAPARNRITLFGRTTTIPTTTLSATAITFDFESAPDFGNLITSTNGKLKAFGYMTLVPTAAGDRAIEEAGSANPLTIDELTPFLQQQQICYVASIFIDTVPSASKDSDSSVAKSSQNGADDTSFEKLAKQVLRWVVSAFQADSMTPEQVDELIASDEDLERMLAYLDNLDDNPTPIRNKAIETFLSRHLDFDVHSPFELEGEVRQGAYFPMPLTMRIQVPAYNGSTPLNYSFADYNVIDRDYMNTLKAHFDQLRVQVAEEEPGVEDTTKRRIPNEELPESVAAYIRCDYFLLVAKQMVKFARESLRNFKYLLPENNETLGDIMQKVRQNGQEQFELYDLLIPNADHPLNAGQTLRIGTQVLYTASFQDSFVSVAAKDFDHPVSAETIAIANKDDRSILFIGREVTYKDQGTFVIRNNHRIQDIADHFRVSLRELFVGSDFLEKSGYLRNEAVLSIPLLATYAVQSGETFDSIASSTYGNALDGASLVLANMNSDILQIGAEITVNGRTHKVQARQDFELVCSILGVTPADLINNGQVATQQGLLKPFAEITIPEFDYPIAEGDTLEGITKQFDVSMVLFLHAANEDQKLFSRTDNPYINLVHLERYKVGELINEIQRSLSLQHLSGMVSRFYLHGLRLPTEGITAMKMGMWVETGVAPSRRRNLPAEAGLFALTGQQFPVPDLTEEPLVILMSDAPRTWMQFVTANGPVDQLRLQLDSGSSDHQQILALQQYIHNQRLDTRIMRLGDDDMYDTAMQTYSLANAISWKAASGFSLPYGEQASDVPSIKMWKLPDSLINLPFPEARSVNPTFELLLEQFDEASGGTKETPLGYYGWASNIEFTIKQIQPIEGSSASANTYEIVGAATNDIVLMERLLTQTFGSPDEAIYNKLILTYPGEKGGVNSDVLTTTTMGLTKVNLTTVTLPPKEVLQGLTSGEVSDELPYGTNLLNAPSEFIQLLWEGSITRSGGFYLYYYNGDRDAGLPDRIFNDKGEAKLHLMVIYQQSVDPRGANRMMSFMNAAVNWSRVDSSNTSVVARARFIEEHNVPTLENETLNELAYKYYADVADIVEANKDVPLQDGVVLSIQNGVYMVPPAGIAPGGAVSDVASHLVVSQAFLRKKNTRVNWSEPLPSGSVVYIPDVSYTVGGEVDGGNTLGSIATFYGLNVVMLAADNADLPGLFASGQKLVILSGPSTRKPTVTPDVLAVEIERPVPEENLDDPGDPNFAQVYLENMYHLLAYRIKENLDYEGTSFSLPIGPTTVDSDNIDKINIPDELKPGDSWEYRVAFPYLRFFKSGQNNNPETLPDGTNSPYRANGSLFQANYEWRDLFGNLLMTKMTQPVQSDLPPYNQTPLKVGYVDALIGLPQWPSVSSNYRVVPASGSQRKPAIQINLDFDSSRYEGLLSVQVMNEDRIRLTFTAPLDQLSAENPENYEISEGIQVSGAKLRNGNQVVLQTTDLLEGVHYEILVQNVKSADVAKTFSGSAGFNRTDNTAEAVPAKLQEAAQRDLRVYELLWHQLTDPHGIILSLKTSLLTEAVVYNTSQFKSLVEGWIGSIYQFIQDRASGGTSVAAPASSETLTVQIEDELINPAQIYRLTVALSIRRASGIVMGDLASTSELHQVESVIAPFSEESESGSRTLDQFAVDFEHALSVVNQYKVKVATGVDRREFLYGQSGGAVWVVRLGLKKEGGIFYQVNNADDPVIFAPRPISNELQTRTGISIQPYQTGVGMQADKAQATDYVDIDMDVWGKQFTEAVDAVLTPRYTSALQILEQLPQVPDEYLKDILDSKKTLADVIKNWMMPVFKKDAGKNSDTARETFRQRLLTRLSNAYKTHAALEFSTTVDADIVEDPVIAAEAPRLFGNIRPTKVARGSQPEGSNEISFTSPKLRLDKEQAMQPLTFLLNAPGIVLGDDGQVISNIDLALTYEGVTIEHQIKPPASEQNKDDDDQYKASSWLGFVLPEPEGPLTADLGQFKVPLVLRSYPEIPTMVSQEQEHDPLDSNSLQDIIKWAYQFTYSRTFHYPQDRLHCTVTFNEKPSGLQLRTLLDAFNQLAQFLAVYSAVQKDLDTFLAPIDAKTVAELAPDAELPDELANAKVAIQTYRDLLKNVSDAASASSLGLAMRGRLTNTGGEAIKQVKFVVQESTLPKGSVDALLVGVFLQAQNPGEPPAPNELGEIRPEIKGYRTVTEPAGTFGDLAYTFVSEKDGAVLTAVDGQKIQYRELVLPDMDILEVQDARSSMQIKRNEQLIENIDSQDEFVYTTGDVKFANPYLPLIDSEEEIEISALPNQTTFNNNRSLKFYFNNFFNNLLLDNSQSSLTFQINGRYQYDLSDKLEPIFLPIFIHPPRTVENINTQAGSKATKMPKDMIDALSAAIHNWMDKQQPPKQQGSAIGLDVIVMTNLTAKPVPLLRLRGLTLDVAQVDWEKK